METSATTQISRLQRMGLDELRERYREVFGRPTKSRNRKQLFAQIAKKIQADRAGQKTDAGSIKPTLTVKFKPKRKAKKAAAKKAKAKTKKTPAEKTPRTKPIGQRDPRLPKVGTTITKKYKGKTLNVRVLEKGFEYENQVFRSLSGVAKHVTGSIWNGFGFFGLLDKGSKKH